jgi:hypothetical protein
MDASNRESIRPRPPSIGCWFCGGFHATIDGVRRCAIVGTRNRRRSGRESFDEPPQHCGVVMLPILWGYPSDAAFDAQDRGELIIGGSCVVSDTNPEWQCPKCHHQEPGSLDEWHRPDSYPIERFPPGRQPTLWFRLKHLLRE